MNKTTPFDPTSPKFLMTTAAPVPVHCCEVITIIMEELWACFSMGYTTAIAMLNEMTIDERDPRGTPANEILSRMDINWSSLEKEDLIDVETPALVDYIAESAMKSVVSWAGDVNAFYNAKLLREMVQKLCDDYFQIGAMARPDTIKVFIDDFNAAVLEAVEAQKAVVRS